MKSGSHLNQQRERQISHRVSALRRDAHILHCDTWGLLSSSHLKHRGRCPFPSPATRERQVQLSPDLRGKERKAGITCFVLHITNKTIEQDNIVSKDKQ